MRNVVIRMRIATSQLNPASSVKFAPCFAQLSTLLQEDADISYVV
jgi:hypothetical protein